MGLDMYLVGCTRGESDEKNAEIVTSWRKANAVHKWFVDNVQDGVDDCERHREVTKSDLEALADICKEIIENCVLIHGKVKNGYRWDSENNKEIPIWEEGLIVANSEICKELLPTEDGFFFGSTDYDRYYFEDIRRTYSKLKEILKTWDFESKALYYESSW